MKFILLLLVMILAVIYNSIRLNLRNAVVVLLDSKNNVLLVKDKDTAEWQFPGGRIDETDASPLSAALREFKEETEHELNDYKVIHTYDYEKKTRLFIVYSKDVINDSPLNNTEMNERKWYNINNMPRLRQSNENSFAAIKKLIVRD